MPVYAIIPSNLKPQGKIYICIRSWNPENNGMSAASNRQPRTRTPVRVMELLYSIKLCMFAETAARESDTRNTSCRPFVKGDNQILGSAFFCEKLNSLGRYQLICLANLLSNDISGRCNFFQRTEEKPGLVKWQNISLWLIMANNDVLFINLFLKAVSCFLILTCLHGLIACAEN